METLINEIKQKAKTMPIKIYFDMDGVCAEQFSSEYEHINSLKKDEEFYPQKRPITTVINIMKDLYKTNNVEVFILSSCVYENQIDQKTKWLEKYVPFIQRENIHIIAWTKLESDCDRSVQKAKVLEKLNKDFDGEYFLIEDNYKNIDATNKYFGKMVAQHVSRIID